MIRIISPHANVPVPTMKRILCVFRPWLRENGGKNKWKDYRDYLIHYRANPRGMEYMLDLASEFRAKYASSAFVDLLAEQTIPDAIPERHRSWIKKVWTELQIESLAENGYDTIIYLYPDAIGLGWNHIERILLRLKTRHYLVINGRRRIFVWDRDSRRALALRRFIAKAWALEMLLAPALLCVSGILALYDSLAGQVNR